MKHDSVGVPQEKLMQSIRPSVKSLVLIPMGLSPHYHFTILPVETEARFVLDHHDISIFNSYFVITFQSSS